MLGLNELSLFGLHVEDGVLEVFAFVEQRDLSLGIQADRDGRVPHGVGGTLRLDLINDFPELESQVFCKDPLLLPGEDAGEGILGGKRAMGIVVASGWNGKASIEVFHEFWQVHIACFPRADALQTQFLG